MTQTLRLRRLAEFRAVRELPEIGPNKADQIDWSASFWSIEGKGWHALAEEGRGYHNLQNGRRKIPGLNVEVVIRRGTPYFKATRL